MQNAFMHDPKEILSHLSELKGKINVLQFINKHLDGSDVKILVTFPDGQAIELDQALIPYNLTQELRVVIGDSIDEYQRTITNLSSLL